MSELAVHGKRLDLFTVSYFSSSAGLSMESVVFT
jgi:hypothetical protein